MTGQVDEQSAHATGMGSAASDIEPAMVPEAHNPDSTRAEPGDADAPEPETEEFAAPEPEEALDTEEFSAAESAPPEIPSPRDHRPEDPSPPATVTSPEQSGPVATPPAGAPNLGTDLLPRLFDAVPVAILLVKPDGRLQRLNEAARRLLGYRPGEAEATLHLADLHQRSEEARQVREAAPRPVDAPPLDVTLRAHNGEMIPARASATPVRDGAGRVVATIAVYQDRREAVSFANRLTEALERVEAMDQRTSGQVVLARAAHELAQPLTAALGQLDMLLIEGGLSPAAVERVERAADQLDRVRALVHEYTRVANRSESAARGGRS